MPKALIVDDSATIRQLVSMTLGRVGFTVVEAKNGKEALEKAKTERFDLVISDINMPIMDGLEFLKEFRKFNRITPFLILTTETEASKKEVAKKHGATGWIVKPFKPDILLKTVKKVVRLR